MDQAACTGSALLSSQSFKPLSSSCCSWHWTQSSNRALNQTSATHLHL